MELSTIVHWLEAELKIFIELFVILLEVMGVMVVIYTIIPVFFRFFMRQSAVRRSACSIKLLRGLSLGLEFYLAAEILKTVMVHTLEELYTVGVVVILRAILAAQIHWEMKHGTAEGQTEDEITEAAVERPKGKGHTNVTASLE